MNWPLLHDDAEDVLRVHVTSTVSQAVSYVTEQSPTGQISLYKASHRRTIQPYGIEYMLFITTPVIAYEDLPVDWTEVSNGYTNYCSAGCSSLLFI